MCRGSRDSRDLDSPGITSRELSPDLAWLLSSQAAKPVVLVDALVHEHYPAINQLALAELIYPEEAQRISDETILAAVAGASLYSADQDILDWLLEMAHQRIERRRRELARLECLNPRLAQAMAWRWPPPTASPQALDRTVRRLSNRLDEQSQRAARRKPIRETLLAAWGIAMALLLLWGSARWQDRLSLLSATPTREIAMVDAGALAAPEVNRSDTPESRPRQKHGDTHLDLVRPESSRPEEMDSSGFTGRFSAANLPPLSLFSSHEEVWHRLLLSRFLWKTMWTDVWITLYGPEDYEGPRRGRRYQLWVDQEMGKARQISGPLDGLPDAAKFVAGPSEDNPMRGLRGIDDYARLGSQIPWFYLDQQDVMYSPFVRNLYYLVHHEWPPAREKFRVTGESVWLGRPVVVVEQLNERGQLVARFWLDQQLGISYRDQYFANGQDEDLLLEVYLLNFEFDSMFPAGMLDESRGAELLPAFALNSRGDLDPASPGKREFYYAVAEPQPQDLAMPPDWDLGHSVLTFLAPRSSCAPRMPSQHAVPDQWQVFADEYYLGDIPIDDEYSTLCARSADGRQIAFAAVQPNENPTLYWGRLDDLLLQANTFPGGFVTAIEFAPDGRRLAVAVIHRDGQSSEIFSLDTLTGALSRLAVLEPVWELAWKPDGAMLATLEAPLISIPSKSLVHLMLLDLDNGQLTTAQIRNELDWGSSQVAIPLKDWEARFGFPMGGLRDCSFSSGS